MNDPRNSVKSAGRTCHIAALRSGRVLCIASFGDAVMLELTCDYTALLIVLEMKINSASFILTALSPAVKFVQFLLPRIYLCLCLICAQSKFYELQLQIDKTKCIMNRARAQPCFIGDSDSMETHCYCISSQSMCVKFHTSAYLFVGFH